MRKNFNRSVAINKNNLIYAQNQQQSNKNIGSVI